MKEPTPFQLTQLRSALDYLDANCTREEWVTILFAIKSGFGEEGRIEAETWSKNGANFNPKSFNSTWKSLHCKPGGISIGSLIFKAINSGWSFEQNSQQYGYEIEIQQSKRKQKRYEEIKILEAQEQQTNLAASLKAKLLIAKNPLATSNHPYLLTKKVKPFGIKLATFYGDRNSLLIPILGTEKPFKNKIQSLQAITGDGIKYMYKGGKKAGGFYPIQWIANTEIVICEGFATGATLAEHFFPSSSVICAFDAGNLLAVAKYFKSNFPKSSIIIAGDNDHLDKKGKPRVDNPGIKAAKKAAVATGAKIFIPPFADNEIGSDWNDRFLLDLKEANI